MHLNTYATLANLWPTFRAKSHKNVYIGRLLALAFDQESMYICHIDRLLTYLLNKKLYIYINVILTGFWPTFWARTYIRMSYWSAFGLPFEQEFIYICHIGRLLAYLLSMNLHIYVVIFFSIFKRLLTRLLCVFFSFIILVRTFLYFLICREMTDSF